MSTPTIHARNAAHKLPSGYNAVAAIIIQEHAIDPAVTEMTLNAIDERRKLEEAKQAIKELCAGLKSFPPIYADSGNPIAQWISSMQTLLAKHSKP